MKQYASKVILEILEGISVSPKVIARITTDPIITNRIEDIIEDYMSPNLTNKFYGFAFMLLFSYSKNNIDAMEKYANAIEKIEWKTLQEYANRCRRAIKPVFRNDEVIMSRISELNNECNETATQIEQLDDFAPDWDPFRFGFPIDMESILARLTLHELQNNNNDAAAYCLLCLLTIHPGHVYAQSSLSKMQSKLSKRLADKIAHNFA